MERLQDTEHMSFVDTTIPLSMNTLQVMRMVHFRKCPRDIVMSWSGLNLSMRKSFYIKNGGKWGGGGRDQHWQWWVQQFWESYHDRAWGWCNLIYLYLISWYMNSYFCLITKGLVPAIFVLLFSICTFYIFIFCIFSFHNSYSSLSPLNPLSHTKDDVSHTVQLPNLFSNTTCSFYILSHTYYSYCVSLVS